MIVRPDGTLELIDMGKVTKPKNKAEAKKLLEKEKKLAGMEFQRAAIAYEADSLERQGNKRELAKKNERVRRNQ